MVPAQADPKDRPAIADIVQTGPLVRDVDRVVDRQYDDGAPKADGGGDRGRIGQHHHGVEAENVVHSIFRYPQISEPESLGALRDPAHRRHIYRVRRAMRQCHAKGGCVLQGHAAGLLLNPTGNDLVESVCCQPHGDSRERPCERIEKKGCITSCVLRDAPGGRSSG